MHRIVEAQPDHDFVLRVRFSTGEVGLFDVGPYLMGTVYQPLKDPDYFRRVSVDEVAGTICWPNGADFCPDVVHRASTCSTTTTLIKKEAKSMRIEPTTPISAKVNPAIAGATIPATGPVSC